MAELSELEQLLKEHQENDEGLSQEVYICLDKGLVRKANALDDKIAEAIQEAASENRLSGPSVDVDGLRAELAAIEAQMKTKTLTLKFRAIPGPEFAKLENKYPKRTAGDGESIDKFLMELTEQSFAGASVNGKDYVTTIEAIASRLTNPEWVTVQRAVQSLNTEVVDRPFSSVSSDDSPTG